MTMNDVRPIAVRTQYKARPGRRAIVVTDLASLRGPAHGTRATGSTSSPRSNSGNTG